MRQHNSTALARLLTPLLLAPLLVITALGAPVQAQANKSAQHPTTAGKTDTAKARKPSAAKPPGHPSGVVNINTATAAELGRLPGIGPSRADAIIALRTKLKRFERIEQLMRVRGIGRRTFQKLRPMLTLQGPTTLPAG